MNDMIVQTTYNPLRLSDRQLTLEILLMIFHTVRRQRDKRHRVPEPRRLNLRKFENHNLVFVLKFINHFALEIFSSRLSLSLSLDVRQARELTGTPLSGPDRFVMSAMLFGTPQRMG